MSEQEKVESLSEIKLEDYIREEPPDLEALEERIEKIESLFEDIGEAIQDKVYPEICNLVKTETHRWLEHNHRRKLRLWITGAVVVALLSLAALNVFWIIRDLIF